MEAYLADPAGAAHVACVARSKLRAFGQDPNSWESMDPQAHRRYLAAFFASGHDVIVGRRHFTDDATDSSSLAGAGTLTQAEHRAYIRLAIESAQRA